MTAQMDCVCLYVCAEYNRSDNKDRSEAASTTHHLRGAAGLHRGRGLVLGGTPDRRKKKRRRDNAVLIAASLRHQIFFALNKESSCAAERAQNMTYRALGETTRCVVNR